MQRISWKLSLLVLVTSFSLVACPSPDPQPPTLGASPKAGNVQLVNWNELHPEIGSYQIKPPGKTPITFGSIDTTGHLSYKLPDTLGYEAAASQLFGTACTITPANSTFVPAYFFVKSQNDPSNHLLLSAKLQSGSTPTVNDQYLDGWVFAPKAFSVKGAKDCAPLLKNFSFDLQFQQGWNNIYDTAVSLSADGKQVTEWHTTASNSAIPADFIWKQDPNAANVFSTPGLTSRLVQILK